VTAGNVSIVTTNYAPNATLAGGELMLSKSLGYSAAYVAFLGTFVANFTAPLNLMYTTNPGQTWAAVPLSVTVNLFHASFEKGGVLLRNYISPVVTVDNCPTSPKYGTGTHTVSPGADIIIH
jgi:hypothetical protein